MFKPDEEIIYCSVALSETPPLTAVVAEWFYLESGRVLIHDCVATTDVAGKQHVAFSLSRPQNGWPTGRYEIRLAVLSPQEFSLCSTIREGASRWLIKAKRWHRVGFSVVN